MDVQRARSVLPIVMVTLFLLSSQLMFLVMLSVIFVVGSRLVPGWLTLPSEFDIIFMASWVMLLLALYYLIKDNPFWSAAAAMIGLGAGLEGFLTADEMLHHLQGTCATQPLPFTTSQAYRVLGLTSLLALTLNAGVLSVAMRRAAEIVLSRAGSAFRLSS